MKNVIESLNRELTSTEKSIDRTLGNIGINKNAIDDLRGDLLALRSYEKELHLSISALSEKMKQDFCANPTTT